MLIIPLNSLYFRTLFSTSSEILNQSILDLGRDKVKSRSNKASIEVGFVL